MTTTAPASPRTPDPAAEEGTGPQPAGRLAALQAIEQNSVRLNLPCVGTVRLPPPQQLAWYGGIAAVVALGFLDWPVAAVLVAGHLLAQDHRNRLLEDFGEALEEA
ncbi:MAG: hypothetical protein QOH50_4012 [Kribbellaceae bacterium]|jgi:hypothetical protein|nr:hypothetical protein [Kribbellaceae bacterium]